ncbi:UNVERIFIED_ORG: hypothetical protein GGE64_003601 [Rhizobium etli]|uniref:CHAD domain-containing protein n=1 Tax=Rhizobium sophoriradicis TaxID=1535245 RepID=UPI0002DED3E9
MRSDPDGAHEAIHSSRKNLKRLRSLCRLVAREAPEFQEHENTGLRDVARSLSAIRDAAALIGTAQYLQQSAREPDENEALGRIVTILEGRRDWMAAAESGLEQRLAETSDVLKKRLPPSLQSHLMAITARMPASWQTAGAAPRARPRLRSPPAMARQRPTISTISANAPTIIDSITLFCATSGRAR